MQFSIATIVAFVAAVSAVSIAEPATHALAARQNNGRPVPNGRCCAPNRSLKQDVCTVNGATGRCVPFGDCGGALACVADNLLKCDPNRLERGRPFCRHI